MDAHDDKQAMRSGWPANEAVGQDGQHGGGARDGRPAGSALGPAGGGGAPGTIGTAARESGPAREATRGRASRAARGRPTASRGQAGGGAARGTAACCQFSTKLPRETGVLPPTFREKSRSYRTRFLGGVGSSMNVGDGCKVTL